MDSINLNSDSERWNPTDMNSVEFKRETRGQMVADLYFCGAALLFWTVVAAFIVIWVIELLSGGG